MPEARGLRGCCLGPEGGIRPYGAGTDMGRVQSCCVALSEAAKR
jgi:hypothetical protein